MLASAAADARHPLAFASRRNRKGAGVAKLMYTDPFGLCKDKNGNELPADKCRDVTAAEGAVILAGGIASGKWTYSDSQHDQVARIGDCTDYCENAMRSAGLPALGTVANNGAVRTSMLPSSTDFRALGADEGPQAGDLVQQGGHAGIFTGTYRSGFPFVLQNGGSGVREITFGLNPGGSGRNRLAPVPPVFYRRQVPINP